jgi:hypothetical protein
MIKVLIAEYVAIALCCIKERRWNMVLYWMSAAFLNVAVLRGMK